MNEIRVTYSGLIAFTVSLISIFTGIVFTLIVTRKLTPEEFGIWAIIGSFISYFLIIEPIISYWSTRQIARGELIGKTSILTSSVFSLSSIPIYIALTFLISDVSPENFDSLILGVILLPVTFVSQTLKGINLAHKPHATSFSLLVFESVKIPSGLILVYFLDLGIDGAIYTTFFAFICQILLQLYFALPKLKNHFSRSDIVRWVKLSWIPLYTNLGPFLWTLDVLIYSLIIGSVIGVAFYTAAVTISAIIGNSGMISQALYPKLLSKTNPDFFRENFVRLTYFSIPLLGMTIIFSKPALFTLNPEYVDGVLIVIFLSFRSFFFVLTNTFYKVLLGMETVDIEKNPKLSNLLRSNLFQIPTLRTLHYGMYVGITAIVLLLNKENFSSEVTLVTFWAIVGFITQIPFFIFSFILIQKTMIFKIPFSNISKYILATILFIVVYFSTSNYLIQYHESIFDFLPGVIIQLFICGFIYLGITYVIDKKTKQMINSIINEVSSYTLKK